MIADFLTEYWSSINWQTVVVGIVVFVPAAYGLFELVARRSREDLKAERDAHELTKTNNQKLVAENYNLKQQNSHLERRSEQQRQREEWHEAELTDEEKLVLESLSMDKMRSLYNSNKPSDQRIRLALDGLQEFGLVARGVEGFYVNPKGRKWLDRNELLK